MSDARGRILDGLARLVAALTRRVDHLALYPCTVVAQRDDGTLDLRAEDERLGAPASIPYRTLRGLSVAVAPGARVLLGFEGGDPSRPVALLWELGDATVIRVNNGDVKVARDGDATVNGTVSAITTPPAGTPPLTNLVLSYTPPGGAPQTLTISGLPPTVAVTGSWSLAGAIDEGSPVLKVPGG
mgnify:FL=1